MKPTSSLAVFQALLAALLFGASAPLSKLLLKDVNEVPLAGLLYLGSGIGSLFLFGVQRFRSNGRVAESNLTRADIPWLAGAVVAGGVAAPLLLLFGLKLTPASTASLLLNFESVATTLIAVLAFKEAVNRRVIGAVALVTTACILLSWSGGKWGLSFGAIGIIAACLFWGLDNNLTRQISGKNPILIVMIKGLGAGAFSLLLSLLLGMPYPAWTAALLALLVGAVCYGVSIQLFILALRGLGAARTGALFATAPFVGTILSLLFLRETPAGIFWVSLPVMVLGVWLIVSERHRHYHVHEWMEHAHPHQHDDEHHQHDHPNGMTVEVNHMHTHQHVDLSHDHPHTPDLHHRHGHSLDDEKDEDG